MVKQDMQEAKSRDPAQSMLIEVFLQVLSYFNIFEIAQLQLVSKLWRDCISRSSILWRVLDLTVTGHHPVSYQFVERVVERAGDSLSHVYLRNVAQHDIEKYLQLFLRFNAEEEGLKPSGELKSRRDNQMAMSRKYYGHRLRVLFLERVTGLCAMTDRFSPVTWSILGGLQEIQLTLQEINDFMKLFTSGRFPEMKRLYFYSEKKTELLLQRRPYILDFLLHPSDSKFCQYPLVELLSLGGKSAMDPIGRSWYSEFGYRSMQRLIWIFPGLSTFKMLNIKLYENPITHEEQLDEPNRYRLDLRSCKGLIHVDFTDSTTNSFPALPTTIETLLLHRSSQTPRTTRLIDNTLVYADLASGELDAVVVDEYKNLREVDLGSTSITGAQLLDFLSRCDPTKLHTLSIDECHIIKYMSARQYAENDLSCMQHLERSEYVRSHFVEGARARQLFITLLVDLAPNLVRLRTGLNYNVDGVTIKELSFLRYLENVDISGTQVTIDSFIDMLAGSGIGFSSVHSKREALARKARFAREQQAAMTGSSAKPNIAVPWAALGRLSNLHTVAVNNCENIREEDVKLLNVAFNLSVRWNGHRFTSMALGKEDGSYLLHMFFEQYLKCMLRDEYFELRGSEDLYEDEWVKFIESGYAIPRDLAEIYISGRYFSTGLHESW
ncbi:uncharacterized protein V1518DRAFT_415880 [Limtongia smithiae]|uniref:uncharacterized protein n=1 Tax=Limtongia smithiae TaxID=1125753 RepID=UPI0034CD6205